MRNESMNRNTINTHPLFPRVHMRDRGFSKTGLLAGIIVVVIVGIIIHLAPDKRPKQARTVEAMPVTVATATQKDVPVRLRAIGKVEPYAKVTIKARVNGELTHVHFKEGQEVKAGDLLFTIDPRPFEVALKEAEARVARNVALAEKAEKDLERYQSLAKGGYISREQHEQVGANAEALRATVLGDQALVETARLNLGYCSIRSPVSGRIGSRQIDQGCMIKANDDSLADIVQIMPLYVDFSVPEQNLPDIKKYMALGPLKVEAVIPNDDRPPEQGEITFMDNEVNRQTGTIRLKGTFANREKRLWPGLFVRVLVALTTRPNAVVVPFQAVQTGQKGEYVFVVRGDLTVEPRPVSVGMTLDGEAVVEKGLTPGEQVVTDGHIRLFAGARVEIKGTSENNREKRS
jgi:membrane fusion protein, multidrug efflux system